MNRLPERLTDLDGLRAARWIRESTKRQVDNFGPESQRRHQDAAIARYGLVDTGIVWSVAHSGRTIAATSAFEEMLAAAGRDFDVLLVGYVSRIARDMETAASAKRRMHSAGAVLLFCDERVLTSDPDQWDTWARETVEAESYSRKLAKRVTEAYAVKFSRDREPGGNPPLGFHRLDGTMRPDPDTIGRAVAVFERYASGTVSLPVLAAETGIDHEALKVMIRNPVYNGWVRRHRRKADEQILPASWRADPPVSDALWARVQAVRGDRDTGGGRSTRRHVHLLAGRLFCACGVRIRAEATTKRQRWVFRRYRHRDACEHWDRDTRIAGWFEDPIAAQVQGMRVGPSMLVRLRALAAGDTPAPDATALLRRQAERDLEDLARRHARRQVSTDAYLAEHARLTAHMDAIRAPERGAGIDPDRAIAWLRDVRRTWAGTTDEGRRAIVQALYERITVTSEGFVSVRLTPAAQAHGAALSLPVTVALARPEGREHRPATVAIPIEGRDGWRRAERSA